MTGPEHYWVAEERLKASDWQRQQGGDAFHEAAMAQVHATLALAAATAMAACGSIGMHSADFNEWDQVAGVQVSEDEPQRPAKADRP